MEGETLAWDVLLEGDEVEAKAAQGRDGAGAIPKSIWATYSAFANSYSGYILLGVEERSDGTFHYLGLSDPEKLETDLWNQLNSQDQVNTNILSREDVTIEEPEPGVRILMIRVPQARREQRPVFVGRDPYRKGTYKRFKDGDYVCSREEVQRMFAEAAARPPQRRGCPSLFNRGPRARD
ncbi:MAG: ATP-binding protein, partial [Myxococcota bacterium]